LLTGNTVEEIYFWTLLATTFYAEQNTLSPIINDHEKDITMASTLSFSSFNLQNFQQAGKKIYSNTVTVDQYNAKLDWTRSKVLELDTDIICFQELWSRSCLDDVFSHPSLSSYTLEYIKNENESPWYGIAVAVAIRSPWKASKKNLYKKFEFTNLNKINDNDGEDDEVEVKINRFSRTIINLMLKNETNQNDPEINLYVAHLKSKLPARVKGIDSKHQAAIGSAISTIRRTAEAAALRWLLTNAMKQSNTPTVLIGDLNDDPTSNTLALITQQPSLASSARGSDTSLYSTLQLQQLKSFRDVFYTHEFNRLKGTIDHILVSQEFFEHSANALWEHVDTSIWNDHLNDNSSATSDHGIVKSVFKKI
jgi:Endonuclease/Exonuclease/phosphatase family